MALMYNPFKLQFEHESEEQFEISEEIRRIVPNEQCEQSLKERVKQVLEEEAVNQERRALASQDKDVVATNANRYLEERQAQEELEDFLMKLRTRGWQIRPPVAESVESFVDETVKDRPIADLKLSDRANKAVRALNIQTIGELCARTESEIMSIKDFGVTSLVEVKSKLGTLGLTLQSPPDGEPTVLA